MKAAEEYWPTERAAEAHHLSHSKDISLINYSKTTCQNPPDSNEAIDLKQF
jgi:hypothetical protein